MFNIRQKITGILHADLRTFMTELITSVTLLVNKANLVHDFFLSIFILSVFINLYITSVNLQLNAQNSYLSIYNIFIYLYIIYLFITIPTGGMDVCLL